MSKKLENAVQSLPDGYEPIVTIDIAKQTGLAIGLNIVGLILFFLSYPIFFRIVRNIRSTASTQFFKSGDLANLVLIVIGGIFFMAALIILHEAIHGLFFRLYTGVMPKFAVKLSYAYAAAPDWYIRRNAYLLIGAAPALFITVIGFLSCLFVQPSWLVPIVLFISLNFASSVGDFYVLLRLMTQSPEVYIQDEGAKMTFYQPVVTDKTL